MDTAAYSQIVRYKQWADRGLHEVVARQFGRLDERNAALIVRILDHIHAVDRIFRSHLQGLPHGLAGPRSAEPPEVGVLMEHTRAVDDWYVCYVGSLTAADFEQPLELVFTSGARARMTRGEILLHVCLHGAYHRGNAGVVLQLAGISPNDDRLTDFIEQAA